MKAQAVIRIGFEKKENLDAVLRALSPEAARSSSSRSHVKIEDSDNVLILKFEARDTSAMRAVINSYMHWALLLLDTFSRLERL